MNVALELNKLTGQVEAMGQALAGQQQDADARIGQARAILREKADVTQELLDKINVARLNDAWRRGATPLSASLDARRVPAALPQPATLIAADGSQLYPDRHGMAFYFLVNVGSIVLRQGSGQAPSVDSAPAIFCDPADLFDDSGRLRDPEYVNAQRDRQEISTLADLAERERQELGGDLARPVITLTDGPLRPWASRTDERETRRQAQHFRQQLARLRRAHALPAGYVDQPSSGYVLRILELLELPIDRITRDELRKGPFRHLADQALFADLLPNQRTSLFIPEGGPAVARPPAGAGAGGEADGRIAFFYLNVARKPGESNAVIARVEVPEWVAREPETLDLVQHAIYTDCQLTGFPYVLARAHEVAVVGSAERADLETMVGQFMMKQGLLTETSNKAWLKRLTARRGH